MHDVAMTYTDDCNSICFAGSNPTILYCARPCDKTIDLDVVMLVSWAQPVCIQIRFVPVLCLWGSVALGTEFASISQCHKSVRIVLDQLASKHELRDCQQGPLLSLICRSRRCAASCGATTNGTLARDNHRLTSNTVTELVRSPGYAEPHHDHHRTNRERILTFLTGNDPELDPDREPEPPTKAVDKPVQRTGKRNAAAEGPAAGRGGQQTARGDLGACIPAMTEWIETGDMFCRRLLSLPDDAYSANVEYCADYPQAVNNRDDGLRSDRNANRTRGTPRSNLDKNTTNCLQSHASTAAPARDVVVVAEAVDVEAVEEHHVTTVTAILALRTFSSVSIRIAVTDILLSEHEKQAAHGWGANDGNAEWADENAGEAIAQAEAKNESGFTPDTSAADPAFSNGADAVAEEAAAEPEEKTKSYDEYLAELAEKKLALGENLSVRKPNEGSKQKFPEGKAFSRETEDFFVGGGGKAKKVKEAGDKKERVALDGQYYQAPDAGGDRGGSGRGRGRGGRGGRGEFRGGDRGRGGRGRGGDSRGGARGDRAPRGGGGGGFNANDESAFPALGA